MKRNTVQQTPEDRGRGKPDDGRGKPDGERGKRRPYYGWAIVVVVGLLSLAGGIATNPVLGVFQGPMTQEFGWTRSMYTAPMTVGTIVGGIVGLLLGPALDRYGGRWIMGAAVVVLGAVVVLMSVVQDYWQHFVLQTTSRAVLTGSFFLVSGVIIPKWFVALRGRAMAFTNVGQRIGQVLFPLMAERIIQTGSWRVAWATMGATMLALTFLPTTLFLRRRPEDHGLLPDGASADGPDFGRGDDGGAATRRVRQEVSLTVRQVVRTPAFYLVTLAITVLQFVTTSVHFHWFSYLTDRGIPSGVAVTSLVVGPIVGMPVSILAGLMAERVAIRYLLAMGHVLLMGAIVLMLLVQGSAMAYVFGAVWGFALAFTFLGMEIVWADYFGRGSIGAIRGLVSPLRMVSNAAGPLAAAFSFDATGGYHQVFILSAVAIGLSAVFLVTVRPPNAKA